MSDGDEKKLFIDEDWKAQVQREKELAAEQQAAGGDAAAEEAPEADQAAGSEGEEAPGFETLVGTLATQAMFALGVIAPQGQQQVMVNLDEAIYLIEMLKILEEKTQGNLTEDEETALKSAVGELEQICAQRLQQYQQQAMQQAGITPESLRGDEGQG
jgi:hypothetical protein